MHRPASLTALGATVALTLAGCSGPGGEENADEPDPTAVTSTAEQPVEVPDTAPGRATTWVLEQLAAESGPEPAAAQERFAPVFLEEVPAAEVAAVFDQLRALGPFTVTGYTATGGNAQAELTGTGGDRFALSVSTDDAELIQGLFLQPAPEVPEVGSAEEAGAAVSEAAEESSFLLARVSGGGQDATCEPVHAREADALRPVGSVFKLYVLAAVVEAVADDELAWDGTLTLTDDLRSLPSGTLQEEPAGTEVSVREAAGAMIAISDNTATDLLIDAVGRERVEAAVVATGHSEPEVILPLLTTREMFQLAFSDPALRRQWVAAGDPLSADPAVSDAQRQVLDGLPGGEIVLEQSLTTQPAWPDGLDWFATAEDLCAAHLHLQGLAATEAGEPVVEILGANPGLVSATSLDSVAFKGGSSVGEIAGSWFVEHDDERYALVIQMASTTTPVPDGTWLTSVADQTLTSLLDS